MYFTFQGKPLVVNIPAPTIQQTNVAANAVPVAMPTSHRPMYMKVTRDNKRQYVASVCSG